MPTPVVQTCQMPNSLPTRANLLALSMSRMSRFKQGAYCGPPLVPAFWPAVTMFVTTDGAIVAHSGSTLLPVVVQHQCAYPRLFLADTADIAESILVPAFSFAIFMGWASKPAISFPRWNQPGREGLPPVSGRASTPIRPNLGKKSSSNVVVAGCCLYRFRLGTGPIHDISLLAEISSSTHMTFGALPGTSAF